MQKVLFVDDCPQQLAAARRCFRRRFDVVTAESAVEALGVLAQSGDIDAIVSDLRMPGMDGVAFLEAARTAAPTTARIMVTGAPDLDAALGAINRCGVSRFLGKPYTNAALSSALDSALAERAGLRDAGDIAFDGRLRAAIDQGRLNAHFQPIVRLSDGARIGYEALARWRDPHEGFLSPRTFIDTAERTGHLQTLSEHILNAAAQSAFRWRRHGFGGYVSTNVAPSQLVDDRLFDALERVLDAADAAPEAICIEITEDAEIVGAEAVFERLSGLRRRGVSIAMDDFGAGYSNFENLKRMPLDRVKLDRCIVEHIDMSEREASVARAVIALARQLGLGVVAEGIERETQRDILLAAGCDAGQGFLFAKALPPDAVDNDMAPARALRPRR